MVRDRDRVPSRVHDVPVGVAQGGGGGSLGRRHEKDYNVIRIRASVEGLGVVRGGQERQLWVEWRGVYQRNGAAL